MWEQQQSGYNTPNWKKTNTVTFIVKNILTTFFKRFPFFIKVSSRPYFSSHTRAHITQSQMFSALSSSTCSENTALQQGEAAVTFKNKLSRTRLQVCGVSLQSRLLEIITAYIVYNFIQHNIRRSIMSPFLQNKSWSKFISLLMCFLLELTPEVNSSPNKTAVFVVNTSIKLRKKEHFGHFFNRGEVYTTKCMLKR